MGGTDGSEAHDRSSYEKEARERWGRTDAYKESARRTRSYKAEDWARIKAEAEDIDAGMAELMRGGETPDGPRAMDQAERARLHIDRWYYPCSHGMHAGLADLYTADPRFAESFDKRAPGLAAFLSAAIKANAARHGA
ncbi:MAG TPA: TipAS antibiotic-recognition domain-containing protein [Longimicrobiales bacterium]|nr:TipAS antibiotic-recognition domain-containing protein [Longimicrobiales bacterium]